MARAGWTPLSVLLFADTGTYASAFVLRRAVGAGQRVSLIYCGDRMHGAVSHGAKFTAVALPSERLPAGLPVVACVTASPELLRVVADDGDAVGLAGDADPAPPVRIPRAAVVAAADLPVAPIPGRIRRSLRRAWLDLVEATTGARALHGRPRDTVRDKYDEQSATYAANVDAGAHDALLGALRHADVTHGRVIVAGCGAGGECFALARAGYSVVGVDFAPRMLQFARELARERGLGVEFVEADLTGHVEPPASVDVVVFTPDVYSFVPRRRARIAMLRAMRGWLRDGGLVFLSARRDVGRRAAGAVLALEWFATPRAQREFGATHTRWIAPDGSIGRSFVHVFGDAALRREIAAAGFTLGGWEAGRAVLRAQGAAASGLTPDRASPRTGPTA